LDLSGGAVNGIITTLDVVENVATARDAATAVGGRAWFFNKSSRLEFAPSASEKIIFDRLKRAMDPENTLSPVPW